jgi:hypothetical protein
MQQQEQQEHVCPSCKMHVGPARPQSLVTPHLARDAGCGANEMAWSADGLEGAVVATKLPVSLCSSDSGLSYTSAMLRNYILRPAKHGGLLPDKTQQPRIP